MEWIPIRGSKWRYAIKENSNSFLLEGPRYSEYPQFTRNGTVEFECSWRIPKRVREALNIIARNRINQIGKIEALKFDAKLAGFELKPIEEKEK